MRVGGIDPGATVVTWGEVPVCNGTDDNEVAGGITPGVHVGNPIEQESHSTVCQPRQKNT